MFQMKDSTPRNVCNCLRPESQTTTTVSSSPLPVQHALQGKALPWLKKPCSSEQPNPCCTIPRGQHWTSFRQSWVHSRPHSGESTTPEKSHVAAVTKAETSQVR